MYIVCNYDHTYHQLARRDVFNLLVVMEDVAERVQN